MSVIFRIGCSGFYNKHWKEIFYPVDLPQGKWFNFYCEHFNTLELNVTFYQFPTAERLKNWFVKSPDDFLFSIKAPKLITHLKRFNDCNDLLKDFYLACEKGLRNKLATALFQFPPGMIYSEEKLEQIIKNLNPGFKNVVEFRSEAWWNKTVYDELRKAGVIFCCVDHPKLPGEIKVTSEIGYLRLHGSPRIFYSNYSNQDILKLKAEVTKKRKLKEAFIFFNNTAGVAGIQNALFMKSVT